MPFDFIDEDRGVGKERALSIFKQCNDAVMYTVKVKYMKKFQLALKYISLGSSFRTASRIFQVTKGELNFGYLGRVQR